MRTSWRLASCLLVQAVLIGQAPEVLWSSFVGPATFDPVRGRVVRVLYDRTTWEWDGSYHRSLAAGPDPGAGGADMVFDAARGQVVMCNNRHGAGNVYAYEGTRWTPLGMPANQFALHLVYDAGRSRLVLLTQHATLPLNSTWEYVGGTWVAVNTATSVPFAIPGTMDAATYDPLTGRTMWVTGHGVLGNATIWWYDGVDWSVQSSGTPHFQEGCTLAFDAARSVVVMYCRTANELPIPPDVWEWNGTAWTNRGPGVGTTVSSFPTPSLAFDPERGRLLGFGGHASRAFVAQWDGSVWTVLDQPPQPFVGRFVYDARRDAMVAVLAGRTSEWRDGRWVTSALPEPPIESAFFDVARGAVVGVSLAQRPGFWTWDGSTWNPQPSGAGWPLPRIGYALSFDPMLGRITMFGGRLDNLVPLGDTWQWNGATWFPLNPAVAPSPRSDALMVRDIAGGRTILAGGVDLRPASVAVYGDTWSFNGQIWQQIAANQTWMLGYVFDLVYDDAGNRVLAVNRGINTLELRTFGATGWQLLRSDPWGTNAVPAAAFESRRGTTLVWDTALGSLMRLPAHPSVAARSGSGCGRPLQVSARTWPRAGERQFGFDVQGIVGAALVAVSTGTANTPLGGNCTALLPSVDIASLVFANAAGFGSALLPIPDLPFFRGLPVFAQAAQLDPTSPIGVGLSARLDLVVGD